MCNEEDVLDIIDLHGGQATKYAAPGLGPYSRASIRCSFSNRIEHLGPHSRQEAKALARVFRFTHGQPRCRLVKGYMIYIYMKGLPLSQTEVCWRR